MDLRPRKKPKHQDASVSEASNGYVTISSPAHTFNRLVRADCVDSNRTPLLCLLHRHPSPKSASIVLPLKPLLPQTRRLPQTFIHLPRNERDSLSKRVPNPPLPGTTFAVVPGNRNLFLDLPPATSACQSLGTLRNVKPL